MNGIFTGPWIWTPESGFPLTNGPLDGTQLEASTMNILGEWLHGFFTGSQHYLFAGTKTLTFPLAGLYFGQSPLPQPLEGVAIRLVLSNPGTAKEEQYANAWRTKQTIGLEIYVQANQKAANAQGDDISDYVCRTTSDALYALLLDRGASVPLQDLGFRRIRPTAPGIVFQALWKTRRIRCSMDLYFDTPASLPNLGGDN
jgi:hypothetical protein